MAILRLSFSADSVSEIESSHGAADGLFQDAEEHAEGDEWGIIFIGRAIDPAFDFAALWSEEKQGGSVP